MRDYGQPFTMEDEFLQPEIEVIYPPVEELFVDRRERKREREGVENYERVGCDEGAGNRWSAWMDAKKMCRTLSTTRI